MDASTLQSLLNDTTSSTTSPIFDLNALLQPLMPYIIIMTVVSIAITVLYLVSIIQKWRANAAIIEIRDILRDMHTHQQTKPQTITPSSGAESSAT